jgi:hypothetical protein
MHEYPKSPTVIDLLYSKLPLFTQRKFMKRALIVWIALIRGYFMTKKTEEDTLLEQLDKERGEAEYRDLLERLRDINKEKLEEKKRYESSWAYKIRNWVSKGISIFFLIILVKNMIPGLNFL